MLRPAAVTAAAVLLLLCTGLTPAEASSDSDFTLCSRSFYRHSPPQGSFDRPLRPLCHTRAGQTFATLYHPDCASAVYSAFLLSNEQSESREEDVPEAGPEEEESISVVVPALLRGDGDSPELSPLQQWDSTVASLVRSSVSPRCRSSEGDLYVLIGAGRGDEAGECQTKPLWFAACCSAPEDKDSFSAAFIRETEEGEEREVTVEELQGLLGGVTELFSGGCGGEEQSAGAALESTSGVAASEVASEGESENASPDSDQTSNNVEETSSPESQTASDEKPAVARSAKTSRVSADSDEGEEASPSEPSPASETVEEPETDDNSTSVLFYILSTTVSVLKAPLHPVMSTITELPGQVSYVLQEDMGVLSALPGDTYSVLHLLVSDVFSWIGSAVDLVLGVLESIFSRIYFLISSMGEALLCSCCTGVTGMGTLAGDTLGIFGWALNGTWWATKIFGGHLVEQSGGYVGTVVGELGGQASAVGWGFGKLGWKVLSVFGKAFRFGWHIVSGVLNIVLAILDDAFFDRGSVIRNEETIDTSVL